MPDGESDLRAKPKARVIKAPAARRAELIDCAQRLFLLKGYEKTTINDVIAATGLSKGAFYHHFRAKEDLLEAIAARFGAASLARAVAARGDALQRLNDLLAVSREWKIEHLPELRGMFVTLLRPENAVLYQRIVTAVFASMAPVLTAIIEQGAREGVFDVADAATAADALLWLGHGRRPIVVKAMEAAEAGDVEESARMILRRLRAEEAIVDRILGVPPGSVRLIASVDELKAMILAWIGAEAGPAALRG